MSLLKMSSSAGVLILVIVIFHALLLHKLPKKTFLVLWEVVLCRLLIPFTIPSRLSIYSAANILKNRFYQWDLPLTGIIVPPDKTAISENISALPEAAYTTIFPVTVIWLMGLTACFLFFLITHFRCRREYKTALPIENVFVKLWKQEHPTWRNIQIRQSDRIAVPLTYGIFRPVILLPKETDWTEKTRLSYILMHEFVHIRRFDTLRKLLLVTALCVHWFNPLVWLMYILANQDIELSCDEAVVKTFGGNMKSAYALTLIGLVEKQSPFMPFVNNFSRNAIEERIVAIMKMKKTSLGGIILAFALITGITTAFITSATDGSTKSKVSIFNSGNSGMAVENAITPDELAKVYSVYEPFGLIYDKEKDCFTYNGKLVGEFMDILWSNGEALESGNFKGSIRQLSSPDGKGEVNIKAVRDYTKLNTDGEGELIGIEVVK